MRARGLLQIARGTRDLAASARFYGDQLGLPEIARFDPPGLCFFDLGGVRLLLEHSATPAVGDAVAYLEVDAIDAAVSELEASGVVFDGPPHCIHRDDAGTFGAAGTEEWMAFFRDPDGHVLALVERRPAG